MRTFATKARAAPCFSHVAPAASRPPHRMPVVRTLLREPQIQPKLTIGAVNDPAEREADQVAGEVMCMPDRDVGADDVGPPPTARPDGIVRRQADSTVNPHVPSTASMPTLPYPFIILLDNINIVPNSSVVEATIRQAFEPIVLAAGRKLQFERGGLAHLTVEFNSGGHKELNRCDATGTYGLQAPHTVVIYVGAHEDIRVCHGPRGGPADPDYISQLERVFDKDEVEFARAIANTAIHELAHMIAGLPHSDERRSFMYTVDGTSDLPYHERTRQAVRRHASQSMIFSADEIRLLQEAIRTGQFSGVTDNDIQHIKSSELTETAKTLRHGKKP